MTQPDLAIADHKLVHLSPLRADPKLFSERFPASCRTSQCTGKCCVNGVWADLGDRDRIMAHADLVREHMDAEQVRDSHHWFGEERDDADFPSRRAVATALWRGGCVFLNTTGRCVLQKACLSLPGGALDLKPFFCTAFPITIDGGQLEVGEGYDSACCIGAADGSQDVFALCAQELVYMLGDEGAAALHRMTPSAP